MNQVLISEILPLKLSRQQINESSVRQEGKFIVPALLQRVNSKNENGRIYKRDVLEREIKKYIEGPVNEKRAYGELDHSTEPTINLKNTCINISEIWWDGDEVHGNLEILNTPSGKIVQELLKAGLSVGISSRGTGTVSQIDEDTVEVDDDFSLICWDIVSSPSTHGAYLKPKNLSENIDNQIFETDDLDEIISDILCTNTGFCECILKK